MAPNRLPRGDLVLPESTFIALTRQGIGGMESRVWVNVDAIAFVEAQESDAQSGGSTLHLRGVEDITTMHVKDAVADLVKQLPAAEATEDHRPQPRRSSPTPRKPSTAKR
jgi:hypothetical protein